jgi:serine protease Do
MTCGVLWLAVACAPLRAADPATADDGDEAGRLREGIRRMITAGRDRVFPAMVNINVVAVSYWGGKEHKHRSVGSGTIMSPEGYVLTNYHVTHNGRKFVCTLSDKREIDAILVGEDPLTDLAVLKLDLSEIEGAGSPLPVARFGDSAELRVGDYVMAMGSPFALSRSVTLGIVSNTERVFGGTWTQDDENMELDAGQRTGLFTRWIQHDALIQPGNSGGPLVNLRGEVIGVNELGGSSMGFAIPSNLSRTVMRALIEHGEVARSWIGVSVKPIEKTGLREGVLVNSIVKDGPADRAGLEAGDVILAIDGDAVTVRFPEQVPPLIKRIAELPIGSNVTLRYRRDDQAADATLTTEKLQKDRGDEAAFRAWGISGLEITEKMARDLRLDNTAGVLVSGIRDGSSARLAEPPIQPGDVIRSIDAEPVADLAEFVQRYEKIMQAEPLPEYLLVEFDRRGSNHVTLLKPKPDDDVDPPRELRKAWIGVATQPVIAKLAKRLGHPDSLGFRITRIYPNSKATDSALRVGDVIVALEGEKVEPRGLQDSGLFARELRKLDPDGTATLTVLRDGATQEVQVGLERTHIRPEEARTERNRDFELTVRSLTFFDRDENRWGDDIRGVLVRSVESAGWAGLGGVRSGDLIQRIDRHEIRGLNSYRAAIEAVTKAQPERVVFVVLRGVRTHFQFIEPEWKPVAKSAKFESTEKE